MSSTLSSTEIQTLPKKPTTILPPKMEERRLVRTSSLEKIRRFNSFICSQQYYILPAILAWLRSSQSGLQSSTEKTIFFFRSLIFTNFLYKIYQIDYRSLLANVLALTLKQANTLESITALKMAVYSAAIVLVSEVATCCYLLWQTRMPAGLVFLTVCCFYIVFLSIKSICFLPEKRRSTHVSRVSRERKVK